VYGPAGYCVLKIGLPKFRRSRKLFVVTLGITVLLGGSAGAALYFKSKELGLERTESIVGGACTDVQTMVFKTPSNRLWLRRFIRMDKATGPERVRTALRVAGLLAKNNVVDLIHVSVLDTNGPTVRSQMRARAIGAEVLIAMKPGSLPEMKSPAVASYYEGPISEEGRFYGDKVVVDIDEIGKMMSAMGAIELKSDCIVPGAAENADAKPNVPAKKVKVGQSKDDAHAAKPAAEHAADEPSAAEPSFLDSVLSMVGLGASEQKQAPDPAHDMSKAVADEPEDASLDAPAEAPNAAHQEPAAEHADEKAEPVTMPVPKADEHASMDMPVGD
jgi:hypothetical protein